jgi:hypothetical protein
MLLINVDTLRQGANKPDEVHKFVLREVTNQMPFVNCLLKTVSHSNY